MKFHNFFIKGRSLSSTEVGGTLKCPRCGSTKLKIHRRDGPIDVYDCKETFRKLYYKTGKMKTFVCGARFRYITSQVTTGLDTNLIRSDIDAMLGLTSRYAVKPKYNRTSVAKATRKIILP